MNFDVKKYIYIGITIVFYSIYNIFYNNLLSYLLNYLYFIYVKNVQQTYTILLL